MPVVFAMFSSSAHSTPYTEESRYSLYEQKKLANDPKLAAQILAAYMQENSSVIAQAIKMGNLKLARRAVNGGLNGLGHFEQAYKIGHRLVRGVVTDSRSIA